MRRAIIAAAVVAGLLAGCAPRVPLRADAEGLPPAEFPEGHYRQAAARGQPVFEIDPASSLVVIEVRRAGTLAHLGHDHVVASHDLRGFVAPDEGRADLHLRLDRLVVDEPELRADARFETQPSDEDIAGTRANMLDKLGAKAHPYAIIGVRGVDKEGPDSALQATLEVNGVKRPMRIAARIDAAGGQLNVDGRVVLAQTQFGIAPFSILAGALQVQDQVSIRFRIRARRLPS